MDTTNTFPSATAKVFPADWWIALQKQPQPRSRIKTTTHLNLKTTRRQGARARAAKAAAWIAGDLTLKPSIANAATVFAVSAPYIAAAAKGSYVKHAPADPLARAWDRATPEQRKAFAITNTDAFWRVVDEITSS
jgi:hypothetical protein